MVLIILLTLGRDGPDRCSSHRWFTLSSGWIVGKSCFFGAIFLSYFHSGVSGMVVDIRHGAAALVVLLGSLPPVTIQLGFSLPAFHISSFDCRKTVSLCASRLINCQPECLFSFVQPRNLGWAIGRKNCTVCKIVVITLFITARASCYCKK